MVLFTKYKQGQVVKMYQNYNIDAHRARYIGRDSQVIYRHLFLQFTQTFITKQLNSRRKIIITPKGNDNININKYK